MTAAGRSRSALNSCNSRPSEDSLAPIKYLLFDGVMQADFAVELGSQDDCLEVPWVSPDGKLRYLDLKRQPELLLEITEARDNQDLAEFLAAINSSKSIFETAKCDTWVTNELAEEDEIYGATWKFGCYVDIIFAETGEQISFEHHEKFVRSITQLLSHAPDIPAAAEFIVRRCYYPQGHGEVREGLGITLYSYGYGDDAVESRQRWAIGLKVLRNAILQMSVKPRNHGDQEKPR